MMIKRISIAVASARGVAERWRKQYQKEPGGNWTRTVSGDSEQVYNKLCELGHNPDVAKVAEIIGNEGWSHLQCCGCSAYITRAASFGADYNDNELLLCKECVTDASRAFEAA